MNLTCQPNWFHARFPKTHGAPSAPMRRQSEPAHLPSHAKSTPVAPLLSMFFGCESEGLPILVQRGTSINILQVPSEIGVARVGVGSSEEYWFSSKREPGMVQRCDVTNYSREALFQVSLELVLDLREARRGNNLTTPGGTIVSTTGTSLLLSGEVIGSRRQCAFGEPA